MLKQQIIERHGRIEDIELYDNEPNKEELAELKVFMKKPKPLVKKESSFMEEPSKQDDDYTSNNRDGQEKKTKPAAEPERAWSFKLHTNDSQYLHEMFGGFCGVKTK